MATDNKAASDAVSKRLRIFFEHYNAEKISSIDSLVDKYDGMWEDLFAALEEKYGKEDAAVRAAVQKRLTVYFTHYNKEKLEDIDQLLEKYDGVYDDLFAALEKKYGLEVTARLVAYFTHYNKEKLASVEDLVEKYDGVYSDLFTALEGKYGPESEVVLPSASAVSTNDEHEIRKNDSSESQVEVTKPKDSEATAGARRRLTVYFTHYNKEKLEDIDQLLEKYDGVYDDLFAALEKKYGLEVTARLVAYFTHYNKEKLASVEDLVAKYDGVYSDLFTALEGKYGPESGVNVLEWM